MLAKWTARQTVLSVDPSSTIIKFNISRLPTTTFLNVKIAQKIITVNDCNNDFFLNMDQPRPLFRLFLFFSNKYYNFYNKYVWKNIESIQYPVPGFEPTTFGTWVSSHNH